MSELNIENGQDFNMDEVDDMPQFLQEIDGGYICELSLNRDTGEKDDKPYDNLIFNFVISEELEAKKDHGVKPEDIASLRFSMLPSKKDIENNEKYPVGLRFAKPHLVALKSALNTSSSLEDIVTNAQGVKCTVTFATRYSKVKDASGEEKTYANPTIKKLVSD